MPFVVGPRMNRSIDHPFMFSASPINCRKTSEGLAIGIDFGTTFSRVAVVRNGEFENIPNEHGELTTPSFVAYNKNERLIGDPAKQQISLNAANTIYDVKRLIGRKFNSIQ